MSEIAVARFQADGAAVYLPFGFVPDFFFMADLSTDTNIDLYYFWRMQEELGSSGYLDGFLVNEGATDNLAAAAGMNAYDTSADAPTITTWSASQSVTARSATAHGTYYRPTRTNAAGMDFSAIFECVTTGTTGTTEPTWPKNPSGQVTDNTAVWERVDADVAVTRSGYKGIGIDIALTDDHEVYCLAILADQSWNWGDVVGWTGGVWGA